MPILQNNDWAGAEINRRVIERCVKRCELGDIREWTPEAQSNGELAKGPVEVVLVNLTLLESAKSLDGEELRPGFPVTGRINVWPEPNRQAEAQAKVKELAMAALGLDRKGKDDVSAKLAEIGGWPGLKGKHVMITFDVRKNKKTGESLQEVVRYDRAG